MAACLSCLSSLCLPVLSNLFPSPLCHSSLSVYLTSPRLLSLPPSRRLSKTLQSSRASQHRQMTKSAREPVGRAAWLPACLALSTSPTWSGSDSASETASLFTLTEFYDPATLPRLVRGESEQMLECVGQDAVTVLPLTF